MKTGLGTAFYIHDQAELNSLLASELLLVIACTSSRSAPCKVVSPLIDRLAAAYEGRANIFKVDVEANRDFAQQFAISTVPSILFFKQRELVNSLIGIKPYQEFSHTVDQILVNEQMLN